MDTDPAQPDPAARPDPAPPEQRDANADEEQTLGKQAREKKPLTVRRLRRKIWRGFLFLLAALLIGVFVLTRTGVTKSLVLPQLASALGAEVEAGSIIVTADLSVQFRDVRVRVPDEVGIEGEVFTADRLLVELNWRAIGAPEFIRAVEVETPVLRVSQDAQTGAISATGLGLFDDRGESGGIAIPSVIVRNGRIELGEHNRPEGDPYTVLAEFPISGVLAPQEAGTSGAEGRSFFSLTQGAGETGLELTGYIDDDGLTCTLGDVDLDNWPTSAIPTRFRDLWTRLQLEGRIVPRTISISAEDGAQISVNLESVAITLPFTAENARSDEPARLTDVTGSLFVSDGRISADLTGRAGALEQRAQFDLFGFDPRTAPFIARLVTPRLRWERDIALLDYVPPDVIKQADRFGKPEADVEAVIWLARKLNEIPGVNEGLLARFVKPEDLEPKADTPDAVRLSGTLAMRNGTAAFHGFPYTFNGMSVDFRFNTERLLIENIDGTSPSGARLTGGGFISPLGPTSAVDLDLAVTDLTINDALLAALNPARRQLVDVLFNEREYAELLDEGLVRSPDEANPLLDRLDTIAAERLAWEGTPGIGAGELDRLRTEEAEIRAALAERPPFTLGGVAQVDMRFIRDEGVVSNWTRDIRLHFPEVGFLTSMFPMPAIGTDVRVTIGEDELHLTVDEGRAITGGSVTIDAVMDTSDAAKAASPDGNTLPAVRVEARAIPIGPLLVRAIAGPDNKPDNKADDKNESGAAGNVDERMGPVRLSTLLTALGLGGTVDADADITPNYTGAKSRLDYTISTTLNDLTADIHTANTRMNNGLGTATVDRDTVEFDITGDLIASAAEGAGDPPAAPGARLRATIQLPEGTDWGNLRDNPDEPDRVKPRPSLTASIALPSADLAIPAEPIVALFSESAAQKLADLRERYRPEGTLGVVTNIRGTLGDSFNDDSEITVALSGIERVDFDYQGLRLAAMRSTGSTLVRLGEQPTASFDGFSIDLATVTGNDLDDAGRLSVLKTVNIGEAFATTPLSIRLERGKFESPLTRKSIERLPTLVALAETYEPRGRFDLELARDEQGVYSGGARPRSATISTPRGSIAFPDADGLIVFAGKTGTFKSIRLSSPEATLKIEGDWWIREAGTDIALGIDTSSEGLPPPLLGLAPQAVGEIFDTLELAVGGPMSLRGLSVTMRALPGGLFEDVTASGLAEFADASLMIGLPVTELRGTVAFEAERPDPDRPAEFTLDVNARRARFKGLRVTDARATILTGEDPGSVLVPDFGADAHGGRITASVRISPPEGLRPDGARRYWTDVQLAEVRIAPLLEDIRVDPDRTLADTVREEIARATEGATDETTAEELERAIWDQSEDRSRGLVSASLSFSGTVGTPEGRRGRGRLIAGGGPVVQLPLLTRLVEVSNLQIPVGEDLGLAYANILLDGNRIVLEDFAVLSGRVELLGAGDLILPEGALDLRVRSRALNRVAVLTDVVESLRDELITTRIGGTIAEPEITPVTFEETRRVLGSLVGAGPGERLRSIGSSNAGVRQRIREAGALLGRSGRGEASPTRGGGNDVP